MPSTGHIKKKLNTASLKSVLPLPPDRTSVPHPRRQSEAPNSAGKVKQFKELHAGREPDVAGNRLLPRECRGTAPLGAEPAPAAGSREGSLGAGSRSSGPQSGERLCRTR